MDVYLYFFSHKVLIPINDKITAKSPNPYSPPKPEKIDAKEKL